MAEITITGTVEENVLTGLCWHETLAPTLAMQLSVNTFSTVIHRRIARKALEYLESYGIPPGIHLRDIMEDELSHGEYAKQYEMTLAALQAISKTINPTYVLDQLSNFVTIARLKNAIRDADEALEKRDVAGAQRALYEQPLISPPTPGIWLSDPERALSFLDKPVDDEFFTGIEELDRRGVRPARKTIFYFLAPPKRGKTWFLISVGKQALLHRKSTLHITLENSEELTAQRYVQALYAMTSDKAKHLRGTYFKRDELDRFTGFEFRDIEADAIDSSTRDAVAERLRALKRRKPLLIKEFPTTSLTIGQLNAYLDMLERVEHFKPDLLIVDYPKLMYVDPRDYRLALGRLNEQLRGIAVARNLALVVVAQGNRSSASAKRVSGTMIAEDFSQIGTADTIVTYSQTERERDLNLARLAVYGARTARDHYVVLITQAYEIGQFCLASTYFNKFTEEEVGRVTGDEQEKDDT